MSKYAQKREPAEGSKFRSPTRALSGLVNTRVCEREKDERVGSLSLTSTSVKKPIRISRLDEYLSDSQFVSAPYNEILTPENLRKWKTDEFVKFAKKIRARKEELEVELRRRGYYFRW
jgi:hypothetical protein